MVGDREGISEKRKTGENKSVKTGLEKSPVFYGNGCNMAAVC